MKQVTYEDVRKTLVAARLPVRRKNASGPHEDPELVLTARANGILVTVEQRFGSVPTPASNALTSQASIVVMDAGMIIEVNEWDRFTVVGWTS